jgi:hypothetical protein
MLQSQFFRLIRGVLRRGKHLVLDGCVQAFSRYFSQVKALPFESVRQKISCPEIYEEAAAMRWSVDTMVSRNGTYFGSGWIFHKNKKMIHPTFLWVTEAG